MCRVTKSKTAAIVAQIQCYALISHGKICCVNMPWGLLHPVLYSFFFFRLKFIQLTFLYIQKTILTCISWLFSCLIENPLGRTPYQEHAVSWEEVSATHTGVSSPQLRCKVLCREQGTYPICHGVRACLVLKRIWHFILLVCQAFSDDSIKYGRFYFWFLPQEHAVF